MSYTIYAVSWNFVTHATCSLELTVYKYNELQVFIVIQKLNCEASYKTPFFLILSGHVSKSNSHFIGWPRYY